MNSSQSSNAESISIVKLKDEKKNMSIDTESYYKNQIEALKKKIQFLEG